MDKKEVESGELFSSKLKMENNIQKSTEQSKVKKETFFLTQAVSECWKHTLKDRVKFLLASHGRNQNWLADEIGINKGTLSKIFQITK